MKQDKVSKKQQRKKLNYYSTITLLTRINVYQNNSFNLNIMAIKIMNKKRNHMKICFNFIAFRTSYHHHNHKQQ